MRRKTLADIIALLPQMMSSVHRMNNGKTSISPLLDSMRFSIWSQRIRLCSLKKGRKFSRILKWKAGVNRRLLCFHLSPASKSILVFQTLITISIRCLFYQHWPPNHHLTKSEDNCNRFLFPKYYGCSKWAEYIFNDYHHNWLLFYLVLPQVTRVKLYKRYKWSRWKRGRFLRIWQAIWFAWFPTDLPIECGNCYRIDATRITYDRLRSKPPSRSRELPMIGNGVGPGILLTFL